MKIIRTSKSNHRRIAERQARHETLGDSISRASKIVAPDSDPGAEKETDLKETLANRARSSIEKLESPAREIITMRLVEGESFQAIAATFGKPIETIKTIYYRTIEKIRKRASGSSFTTE